MLLGPIAESVSSSSILEGSKGPAKVTYFGPLHLDTSLAKLDMGYPKEERGQR